jgi:hypothetical protein
MTEKEATETRSEAIQRLMNEAGNQSPDDFTPDRLPLSQLHIAEAVFQPREFFSETHVRSLLSAIRTQSGRPLDRLTVWHSGTQWYVIDGHHRLEAYRQYNAETPKKKIKDVPVRAFAGTLPEAMCFSAKANSKDKLPMRQADKSNIAWRLVCLQDQALTGRGIAQAAGVSRQTVQTMRRTLKSLTDTHNETPLVNLTWLEARQLAAGFKPSDWDDDADERQGIVWADRLGHQFGKAFAANPHAAAYALLHYSPDLPQRLIQTDVFQTALFELDLERLKDEGVADY